MTVSELIEKLKGFDQTALVMIEDTDVGTVDISEATLGKAWREIPSTGGDQALYEYVSLVPAAYP